MDGELYIYIDTESYLQAPTKLWSYNEFLSISNQRSLLLGIFYGALIIMILYNGFLAYSLRDIRYVFYVIFVASFMLLQTVWDGYSLQYIWPSFYKWDTMSNAILITTCGLFLMAFNWAFFEIQTRKSRIVLFYKAFFLLSTISIVSMFFIDTNLSVNIASCIGLVALTLSIFSFASSIPKNKSHYIYITAWSVFFYMGVISTLGGFNIIPYSILAVHGMKIGILILVVLFSLALSYKIKEIEYLRVIEVEKGIALRKLHEVNKKITSIRDLEPLYQNMLEGYKSFFSFEKMIIAIEDEDGNFTLNRSKETSTITLDLDSYREYTNFEHSNVSKASSDFLKSLSFDSSFTNIFIPIESRTSRKGFVLFILSHKNEISSKVKKMLSDYTYQISLTIENITLIQELKLSAERDSLTKLYNRNVFFEKGDQLLNHKSDDIISITMIDIDHFKTVNDTYGHTIGDKALIYISEKMLTHFPKDSIIARYGGEEFVIITQTKTKKEAFELVNSFRSNIENNMMDFDQNNLIKISVSCGLAIYTNEITVDDLVEKADNLLYEAKRNGRNQVATNDLSLIK